MLSNDLLPRCVHWQPDDSVWVKRELGPGISLFSDSSACSAHAVLARARPPAPCPSTSRARLAKSRWAVGWGRGSSRVQLVVPLLVSRSCLRPFVVLPCLTPTLSGIAQLSFPVVGRTTGDKRTNQREKSKIGPDNRLGQGTNQLQFLLGPLLSGPLAARRPWG